MKILLIGGGNAGKSVLSEMGKHGHEVIMVDSDKQLDDLIKENGIDFNKPIPITNPYKDLPIISTYGSGKEFICKGRHQYMELNGQWVCQCGRKIND